MIIKKISIGIDSRPLQGETKHRGIGKALFMLITEMRKDKAFNFTYYLDRNEKIPELLEVLQKNEKLQFSTSSKFRRKKYIRSFLKPFKTVTPDKKNDVFLQFDISLGIRKSVKNIVFFLDLIPYLFHELEKKENINSKSKIKDYVSSQIYWIKYKRDLSKYRFAHKIIAISKSSKNDLIKFDPKINSNNVSVVYLGGNGLLNTPKKIKNKYSHLKPYILYVGGIDYRKNVRQLFFDFKKIKKEHSDLNLVLVGKEFLLKKQLAKLTTGIFDDSFNLNKNIHILGYVSQEELIEIYKNAVVFVFPSLYEGFGLPVLEAMSLGTPVVSYENSSITEIAEDSAILLKTGSPMSKKIIELVEDKKLREHFINKGLARSKKFNWEKTSRETLKIALELYEDK